MTHISKILIANRGEIAVRVARTCRTLGISTVAVYSEADQNALHVKTCDEAVFIGPSAPQESYLRIDKIIAAAKRTGADAVHPGYGFLSENADFAAALEAEDIIFIGPTAETIKAMGSKSAAKDLMEAANVPTTPGYQGAGQALQTFKSEAKKIGYPVLLKATAGGGGKGMRVVEREDDLKSALASAKQEANSAFGDDRFLIEKYIPLARHLEVQIFGDGKGGVVHFFERDCSVQRRHQKIIEEAPAPNLPESVRRQLLDAGVAAGKAVSYRGAGTVEFLYDGQDGVYFMEMNTRLQVEHPVSEMITGVDLVEWQIRVASGEPLPSTQEEITASGHAFEARLYAENPAADFAPSIGTLEMVDLPQQAARIDTGVETGQSISTYYDPMIAKIIVHGPSRSAALGRLKQALADTVITGVETNAGFLTRLAQDPDFAQGEVSTKYIEDHAEALFSAHDVEDVAVCAFALQHGHNTTKKQLGFRLNAASQMSFWGKVGDETQLFCMVATEGGYCLSRQRQSEASARRNGQRTEDLPDLSFQGALGADGSFQVIIDDLRRTGRIEPHQGAWRVFVDGEAFDIGLCNPLSADGSAMDQAGSLTAPMPGVILKVYVSVGDMVQAGDQLASMEAMKMEHTIHAPSPGEITQVRFSAGDQVKDGEVLFAIEADDA